MPWAATCSMYGVEPAFQIVDHLVHSKGMSKSAVRVNLLAVMSMTMSENCAPQALRPPAVRGITRGRTRVRQRWVRRSDRRPPRLPR